MPDNRLLDESGEYVKKDGTQWYEMSMFIPFDVGSQYYEFRQQRRSYIDKLETYAITHDCLYLSGKTFIHLQLTPEDAVVCKLMLPPDIELYEI